MSTRARRRLAVAVALLLVTVPLWAPPLDVTGRDHHYAAAEISGANGTLTVDSPNADRRIHLTIEGLDCTSRYSALQRRCLFEGGTLDENVTGVAPAVRGSPAPESVTETGRYVVLNDGVYRRTVATKPYDGSWPVKFELGLERVPPATALEDVARQEEQVSETAQTVIRDGPTRTDDPIRDANEVLAVDGSHYVVYETSRPQFLSAKPGVERFLEAVCVAAGAFLLLRQPSSSSRSN
ncbi:hypothetical protein [Halolamina sp.]|jgi:hypothetical protein|uniref:hypothetical protein n=1 Tax=Halolamina sp. TaxID=1940283 RepID=UPI000223BD9A|nr:hypothetical protein Halar_3214 [halophilic archaeon DL31]